MKTLTTIAAMMVSLCTGSALAASVTHFDVTVQPGAGAPQIVRIDLAPKGTTKQALGDSLHLELRAPQEDSGEGRSELRLLLEQKDGSFKVLHIAGIATFPNEAVQASYGICGGKVVYRTDRAPGAPVCE